VTLTIKSKSVIELVTIEDKFISDKIARVIDIPNIDYSVTSVNGQTGDVVIDIPVTSVNGQTGDVTTLTSWNELENKPFGEKETRELIAEAHDEDGVPLYYMPLTCVRAP
jgi:hypothetical protein